MPSNGNRMTDTIRAKFSGNRAAEVPPGAASGAGSHAVTGSTPADRDTTQVLPPVGGPATGVGAAGAGRETTQVLRPDAGQPATAGRNATAPAPVSRQQVVAAQK